MKRGFRGASKANNAFIHALSKIGSTKFQFAPRAFARVAAARQDDLDWIGTRMGKSIAEDLSGLDSGVETESDLERIALQHWPDLVKSLETFRPNDPSMKARKLARTLDAYAGLFWE